MVSLQYCTVLSCCMSVDIMITPAAAFLEDFHKSSSCTCTEMQA